MTRFPIDGTGRLSSERDHPTAALTGPAGGDLAGSYPNPTVAALNGSLNVLYHGCKVDGRIVTDASIANATNQLHSTAAAFTSADSGKHVLLHDPVNSAADLLTTISSVAGGVATLAASWTGTTLTGTGYVIYGTDDTAAFQATINAAVTAKGGDIYVPGIMVIAGALGTVHGTSKAQISVPASTVTQTLRIAGQAPMHWPDETLTASQAGSIIVVMSAGATYATNTALPSCIGFPTDTGTNLRLVLENIAFRAPTNPKLCIVDARQAQGLHVRGVGISTTDSISGYTAQPTNPTGIGLIMPAEGNYGSCSLDGFAALGFYSGLICGELTSGTNVSVDCNYIAVGALPEPSSKHGVRLGYVMCNHSWTMVGYNDFAGSGLTSFPDPQILSIDELEWELGGGWQAAGGAGAINDPTNNLFGEVRYWAVAEAITVTGCQNLRIQNLSQVGRIGKQTHLFLAADQSVGAGTALAWTTADGAGFEWDDLGIYPGGASATVLTIPTNAIQFDQSGLYCIEACIEYASAAGTYRGCLIETGGATGPYADGEFVPPVSGNVTSVKASLTTKLDQGSTIQIVGHSDVAATAQKGNFIRTHVTVTRLA